MPTVPSVMYTVHKTTVVSNVQLINTTVRIDMFHTRVIYYVIAACTPREKRQYLIWPNKNVLLIK